MAALSNGAGQPVVNVYHEKSMILPDVSRVLACLYEKNVEFKPIRASYKDLLSLQASRSVPVPFYDGPIFLQDSRAICRYIAEKYEHQGYPFLLGKDVLERASIEQWLRNEEHAFDPPSRALFCHLAFPLDDEEDDEEDINKETQKLEEVLEVYEQRLGETEYLAGNKFTLADLVHLPGAHHVITSERFAYLYDSRKNVQRWWNTISARDSWQKVLGYMKMVEEEHRKELDQKQKQWQAEHLQPFGGRDIRIDPRTQEGTKPQTVLVAPPSTGTVSTSIPSAPQEHETTSDQKPSPPIQTQQGGFFTTTGKPPPPSRHTDSSTKKPPSSVDATKSNFFTPASTPTTVKMHQKTDAEKSSHKDASSTSLPSQRSPKEVSDKPHLSDFFKASSQNNETRSLAKPSPKPAKIPEANQSSGAVSYDKPSVGSTRDPQRIDEPDSREIAPRYAQVETEKQSTYRGAPDVTKEATEADQDRATPPAQQVESKDIKGANSDERFKTERLRRMFTGSEAAELQSQPVDSQAAAIPKKPLDALPKKAIEANQNRGPSSSAKEEPEVDQKTRKQAEISPTAPKVSDREGTKGVISDERFKTERLRRMFEESEAAAHQSQLAASQSPTKEEASAIPKKHSDVNDREEQTEIAPDSGEAGGFPSTSTKAPYTPSTADKSIYPPKGGITRDDSTAAGPERSPSINEKETILPAPRKSSTASAGSAPTSTKPAPLPIQEAPLASPGTDQLAKKAGFDMRAQQETPSDARNGSALGKKVGPSTHVTSDEQSNKSHTIGERVPEAIPRKTASVDSRGTSAPIQESMLDAHGKQASAGRGGIPDVTDAVDGERTEKSAIDKRAAQPTSSSQQTTKPIKGGSPALDGITGDESTKIAMDPSATPPAPVIAPASGGQDASTVSRGDVLDTNSKTEPVKPSTAVKKGVPPTTQGRQEPTPGTQRRATSDQTSAQYPPLPSPSDTRSEKQDLAEPGQTSPVSTNEQSGERVPRNAERSSPEPLPIEDAYKEDATVQQLPRNQSRGQVAENKMQGDDTATSTETGKPKEDDSSANVNNNKTGEAQTAKIDTPSKLQIQSDQNKPKESIDGGKKTNETETYPIISTSNEGSPSPPDKSMKQQQLQADGSGTSLQEEMKKGTGTEQQKNDDLTTSADKNSGKTTGATKSGEQTSSETQKLENSRDYSKSDGPSKPDKYGGDEGNLPDPERRAS
ncbi:hypothetical protein ACP4OV_031002 [Aristida adscensionis]